MAEKENFKIIEGDIVHVCWPHESSIEGIVLYIPKSLGDCWIIETDTAIHYVQQFEDIWRIKRETRSTDSEG